MTWLELANFNQAALKDLTYTHVGIACGCDAVAGVRCGFIFGKYLNANDMVDSEPLF